MCFAASEASQRRGTQSSRRAPSREPRPALGIRRPSSELCLRLCFNSVYLYSISKACPKGSETSKRGHSGDLGTLKKFSMQVKGNCFFASCHPASGTLSQKQQRGAGTENPCRRLAGHPGCIKGPTLPGVQRESTSPGRRKAVMARLSFHHRKMKNRSVLCAIPSTKPKYPHFKAGCHNTVKPFRVRLWRLNHYYPRRN